VIYATTGLNAEGVFLELNNGLPSGGSLKYDDRVPAIVNLLASLSDCGSLDELDAFFNTTRPDLTFIINAADRTRGVSYEWAPFEHRRRSGDGEGLLISTNHFADPSWGIVLQDRRVLRPSADGRTCFPSRTGEKARSMSEPWRRSWIPHG
jgi:hypothetical protein